MDEFSYYNIFETKGIEYLAIIAFFAALIPFWIILNKQVKITKQLTKVLGVLSMNNLRIPQGVFYSRNHTWTHLEKSGIAKVGLDDLLQHITGEITINTLKQPGDNIKKGELLTEIDNQGKKLKILSPISGKIMGANPLLNKSPEMLNEDPYGKAWIYKIQPSNWVAETHAYYLAEEATNWSAQELTRFKDFMASSLEKYAPDPSMVILQDGGELSDNPLAELPNELWQDFQKDFLDRID